MMVKRKSSKLLVAVVCCLAISGCGNNSQNAATITGDIKFEGTPVPGGMIVFSSDTITCSGPITDGKYEVMHQGKSGIPLQEYEVTIFPPKNEFEYNPKTEREELIPTGIDPEFFPLKYRNKTTSGLTFSPVEGINDFPINMEK